MVTFLLLTFSYIISLVTVVNAAIKGKGLFFPDFRLIDKVYFGGVKKVWNTWWGILSYYLQLLVHLAIFIILIFFAVSMLIAPFFAAINGNEYFYSFGTGMRIALILSGIIIAGIVASPVWLTIRYVLKKMKEEKESPPFQGRG